MKWLKVMLCCAVLMAFCIGFVNVQQQEFHCPDGWTEKWEAPHPGIDSETLTLEIERTFCVKAALNNSGIVTGTSFTVNWLNEGGQVPDISYAVFYDQGETPTESPTEESTEEPTITSTPVETLPPPPECTDCNQKIIPVTGEGKTTNALGLIIIVSALLSFATILLYHLRKEK